MQDLRCDLYRKGMHDIRLRILHILQLSLPKAQTPVASVSISGHTRSWSCPSLNQSGCAGRRMYDCIVLESVNLPSGVTLAAVLEGCDEREVDNVLSHIPDPKNIRQEDLEASGMSLCHYSKLPSIHRLINATGHSAAEFNRCMSDMSQC